MKVAFVTDSILPFMHGGKEVRTHHITSEFAKRGIDFTVYTMASWAKGRAPKHTEGICRGSLKYQGSRRSIFSSVKFALSGFQLLFRKFDVLEADQIPYLHLFPLWIVCLATGRPFVVTWHEVWSLAYWREYLGPLGVIAYWIERMSERLPDRIICASDQTANLLRRRGVLPESIHLVRAGVDHLPSKSELFKPSTGISALYVGRLIGHKRVDCVISAAKMLRENGEYCDLMIVGKGPEKRALVELAGPQDWTALGRTEFYDGIDNFDGIVENISKANVFVSASEREGFGISVAEALATGLPAIVTDHVDNNSRKLVEAIPGSTTFKSGSVHDLAKAMLRVKNQNVQPDDVRIAFMRANVDLTWVNCASQIAEILELSLREVSVRKKIKRLFFRQNPQGSFR